MNAPGFYGNFLPAAETQNSARKLSVRAANAFGNGQHIPSIRISEVYHFVNNWSTFSEFEKKIVHSTKYK